MSDEVKPTPPPVLPEVPSLPVVLVPPVGAPPLPPDTTAEQDKRATGPLAPTTTAEQDKKAAHVAVERAATTAGQRRVSLLWEISQSVIAVSVIGSTMYVCTWLVKNDRNTDAAFLLLANLTFSIITFYLVRVNHTRVGGPGGDAEGSRKTPEDS